MLVTLEIPKVDTSHHAPLSIWILNHEHLSVTLLVKQTLDYVVVMRRVIFVILSFWSNSFTRLRGIEVPTTVAPGPAIARRRMNITYAFSHTRLRWPVILTVCVAAS